MAVVREDVVRLTFDLNKDIVQAEGSIESLLKLTQKLGGSHGAGEAEEGFKDAGKAAKKFGDTDLGKLTSGLDNIVKSAGQLTAKLSVKVLKGLTVGVTAGAAGIAALGTQAVKSYAEFEQLKGGIETLFGEENLQTVLSNANNAFKTAGLSANDYMSTVTSFSASLIKSLGDDTVKATEYADRAIVDMADNANKMGTDISMIQNAYQGFAKQNYTMLDNLNTMGALAA